MTAPRARAERRTSRPQSTTASARLTLPLRQRIQHAEAPRAISSGGFSVLAFTSAIEEGLFGDEVTGATWPVEIGGLVRGIEATLGGEAEIGLAIVANSVVGELALT